MDKILQCNVTFNNYREGDFQMRSFKYEGFNELLNDFESDKEINITNTNSPGLLRPSSSKIIETTVKDEFHAEYLIKTHGNNLVKVRFYLEH